MTSQNILLISDTPHTHKLMIEYLKTFDYSTKIANNYLDATISLSKKYSHIFLDIEYLCLDNLDKHINISRNILQSQKEESFFHGNHLYTEVIRNPSHNNLNIDTPLTIFIRNIDYIKPIEDSNSRILKMPCGLDEIMQNLNFK